MRRSINRGQLEGVERAAMSKRNAFEAEVQQTQNRLDAFAKESREATEFLINISVEPLAKDLFEKAVADSVNDAADHSAKRIYNEVLNPLDVIHAVFSKEKEVDITNKCAAVINEEWCKAIRERLVTWVEGIKQGSNPIYISSITDNVKRTNERLRRRWDELRDLETLLREVNFPEITGDPVLDRDLVSEIARVHELKAPSLANVFDPAIAGQAFLGIGGLIAVLASHPLGWLAIASALSLVTIKQISGKPLSEEVIGKMNDFLTRNMQAGLFQKLEEIFEGDKDRRGLRYQVSSFRDLYVKLFKSETGKFRSQFEENVVAARNTFEKSDAERQEIARYAQDRRKEIAVIIDKVKQFSSEVESLLNQSLNTNAGDAP